MLIECLIGREGATRITLDKYDYDFKPRPELTDGDETASVCQVNSTFHQQRLIESGLYKPYTPKEKVFKEPIVTHKTAGEVLEPASNEEMTVASFLTIKNAMAVKAAIKRCTNTVLLDAIGANEAERKDKREWVIEALDARLKELGA